MALGSPRKVGRPNGQGETLTILGMAWPVVIAQLGWMVLGLVDTLMLGRMGPRQMAAAALGDLWMVGTQLMAIGVMMGLDPVISQAHGAGRGDLAGRALQRGIVLALLVSPFLAGLWLLARPVLVLSGQDPVLAAEAGQYLAIQIFSIPFFLCFIATRQYLQARAIMFPSLVVVVLANVVNAGLDWLLIFGHWGFPALGVRGSGLATGCARTLMLGAIVILIRALKLHRGAWVAWDRSVLERRRLWELLRHGLPVGAQMTLEIWAFSLFSAFSGWLGVTSLASNTIALKLASFSFMVPLGLSMATATRVGNLIGAGDRSGAQRAAWTGVRLGALGMGLFAGLFLVGRGQLPRLFLGNGAPEVAALTTAILPIAAAFQIFDGIQGVACGVLRGMGAARAGAWFNFVGFYLLAIPTGLWLAFGTLKLGLSGLWIGMAVGLGMVAGMLLIFIARRGPAKSTLSVLAHVGKGKTGSL